MTETAAIKARRFALPKAKTAEWLRFALVMLFAAFQLESLHDLISGTGPNSASYFFLFSALTFTWLLRLGTLLRSALSTMEIIWALAAFRYIFLR